MIKIQKLNLEYVDIQAILDDLQISYSTRGKNVSENWIGVSCPFCDDHSNHLGLCLTSPVISCFSCGKTGNYLSYLAAELNSWPKAIEIIKKHSPRELKRPYEFLQTNKEVLKIELPKEATKTPSKYQKNYIEKVRQFSLKEMEHLYDFYYCPPIGKWANKIIVPIYFKNQLVTFTSIDIAKKAKIRYLHLSEEKSIIHCKNLLYGYDQIVGNSVLVVEGFFDKARIGSNCVCTMGTIVTKNQIKLLTKFSNVYLAMDGDEAGIKAGERLANELAGFTNVELMLLPEGSDPDKLSKDDIKYLQNLVKVGF